ncbi:MAG: transporter related protein, partial [Verrucomicrobiales bacterium]|nr:transporter related protein [Verrucomicrobiales bacterium]
GPTGSGKSTALKLLAGRLRATEGKVKVFGSPAGRARTNTRIGYLPQPSKQKQEGNIRRWWRACCKAFLWLPWIRQHTYDGTLAKMQRRTALTQVFTKDHNLLILDAPFSNLEPALVCEVKSHILNLARLGKTVILSSNSVTDLVDVCGRIAILYDGKLQAIDSLEGLLKTTDAIRFMAPVLPPATSERVLDLLREGLGERKKANTVAEKNPAEPPALASKNEASCQVTYPRRTADIILASFAQPPVQAISELPKTITDSTNHEMLARLAKPMARIDAWQ